MKKNWTKEEIDFLTKNYSQIGGIECAKKLNRTLDSIRKKALYLRVSKYPHQILANSGHRICTKCRLEKPISAFDKHGGSKSGFNSHCKQCRSKHNKQYWSAHRKECRDYSKQKYWKNPQKYREYRRNKFLRIVNSDEDTRKIKSLQRILLGAKYRSRERNMKYNLDLDWATEEIKKFEGFCPIFNIKYTYWEGKGHATDSSPSIDRINNLEGYTKDNCIIISKKANAMKNNGTVEELYKLANFYQKLKESKEPLDYQI